MLKAKITNIVLPLKMNRSEIKRKRRNNNIFLPIYMQRRQGGNGSAEAALK